MYGLLQLCLARSKERAVCTIASKPETRHDSRAQATFGSDKQYVIPKLARSIAVLLTS